MAATATIATGRPSVRRSRTTARSFLQKRFSTRRRAMGLTFQVSPEMEVTFSTVPDSGLWKRWYMSEVNRRVMKLPS